MLLVGAAGTILFFLLCYVVSLLFVKNKRDRGVVVQGSFRGNLGIVGLAFSINAFGDIGLATASLYMAILTVLYNVLSVLILTQSLNTQTHNISTTIFLNILKNPIIISICAALAFVYLDFSLHPILADSGDYISALTLPLALICIGGSISLRELKQSSLISFIAVTMKLIIAPVVMVALAIPFDFNPVELGVIFLMGAAPTATASYIMVQAMKGNGILAANIVVLSTLGSVISASAGIAILRNFGMI
ncbi:AEC family transporter [Aurantivibrio infirmus]